ncbi:MAG: type I methionyl aminopeptidase [Candidatus Caldatribacteriaceae bacterium]
MGRFLVAREIEALRKSGRILGNVLRKVHDFLAPGVKASSIDQLVEEEIRRQGARPAFLGYNGFPASVCVSFNDQVVHGIPRERIVEEGDLVGIDVGVEFSGFYTDAAFSVVVGRGKPVAHKLVEVTRKALYEGIRRATPGRHIGDISHGIQKFVERNGFSIVRDLVGHGVGRMLHEEPQIPNFGRKGQGPLIEQGMTLAIEPMVNEKGYQVKLLEDSWTIVTVDGGLSAHFEHTVLVTDGVPEILTSWERG